MSELDKTKWDTRYREGAYATRTHPSEYLVECLASIRPPVHKALDLACGAGRNAMYLATRGWVVDAVDIASEALQRGRQTADAASIPGINWIGHDLDKGLPDGVAGHGLVIMMRYLDLGLLASAAMHLTPGGYLVAEVHMQTDQVVAGPTSARYRAAAGELRVAVQALEVIHYAETICQDPDGSTVALARVLAQKPERLA